MNAWGMLRLRYLLLAAVGIAAAWPIYRVTSNKPISDYYLLVYGGRALVGTMPHYNAGPLHLYATHPMIQVGPPALLILGALVAVTVHHQLIASALILGCGLGSVRALERTAMHLGVTARRAALASLIGGALMMGTTATFVQYYHLEDALALLAVFAAMAALAARRPWWTVALLLGFAVACKPWAVMLLGLLLVLPQTDQRRAFALTAASAAVWWLPFIIADPGTVTQMASYMQVVHANSVMAALGWAHILAPGGTHLVMMLLGLCFGALAVLRGRWVAVPLIAMLPRVLLEPRFFAYYALPLVAGAWLLDTLKGRVVPWLTIATAVPLVLAPWFISARLSGFLLLAYGVAVIGAVLIPGLNRRLCPAVSAEPDVADRPAGDSGRGPREVVEGSAVGAA